MRHFDNPTFNASYENRSPSFAECVAMFKRGEASKSPEMKRILAQMQQKQHAKDSARQRYLAARENERRMLERAQSTEDGTRQAQTQSAESADKTLSWESAVLKMGDGGQSAESGALKTECKLRNTPSGASALNNALLDGTLLAKKREQKERKINAKLERMRFEARLKAESEEKARQARGDFLVLARALALV